MTQSNDRTIDRSTCGTADITIETTDSPDHPTIIVISDPENGDRIEFTTTQVDALRDDLAWALTIAYDAERI